MTHLARAVVEGVLHHVAQRGDRRHRRGGAHGPAARRPRRHVPAGTERRLDVGETEAGPKPRLIAEGQGSMF